MQQLTLRNRAKRWWKQRRRLEGELIATADGVAGAPADLHGLTTCVFVRCRHASPNCNARFRNLEATRISRQWAGDAKESDLYPSIRKLPLLGVTYADLYRKTKVEETSLRNTDATIRARKSPGSQRNSKRKSPGPSGHSREESVSAAHDNDDVGYAFRDSCWGLLGIGQGQLGKNRSRGSRKDPCAEHGSQHAAATGVRGATTGHHVHAC